MAQAKSKTQESMLVSSFILGDSTLGIETSRVQEVIKAVEVTRVHHAPDCVLGIMNLRGRIVTVLDLGVKLGLDPSVMEETSRVIIVDWKGEYVGLLVDHVSDVVDVQRTGILPSPSNVKGVQGRFFEGVFHVPSGKDGSEGGLVAILDVDEAVSEEETDGAALGR